MVTINFKKPMFLCIVILFFLSAVESYFRFFYTETDSRMVTLSSKKWANKYYRYNNHHFRDDKDFGSAKPKGVLRIGILGDSFVEAQGVKNPKDRFSNILEDAVKKKFNINCEVYNLGRSGWDTIGERNFFTTAGIGYNLDMLILSVFELDDFLHVNMIDIPELMDEHLNAKDREKLPSKIVRYFTDHSYAVSFFYAQFLKVREKSMQKAMVGKVNAVMANNDNWNKFMKIIFHIERACRNNNIQFYLVSFPPLHLGKNADLLQVQATFEKTFESCLRKTNIKHLFLTKYFDKYAGENLTVSRFDLHPNELANKIVAETLLPFLDIEDRRIMNS